MRARYINHFCHWLFQRIQTKKGGGYDDRPEQQDNKQPVFSANKKPFGADKQRKKEVTKITEELKACLDTGLIDEEEARFIRSYLAGES